MKPRPLSHCLHGHALTADNLYVRSNGSRYCRACRDKAEADRCRSTKTSTVTTVASRPSDHLIAEARRRAEAPRSLSAMILGDPPIGFSALDRIDA